MRKEKLMIQIACVAVSVNGSFVLIDDVTADQSSRIRFEVCSAI